MAYAFNDDKSKLRIIRVEQNATLSSDGTNADGSYVYKIAADILLNDYGITAQEMDNIAVVSVMAKGYTNGQCDNIHYRDESVKGTSGAPMSNFANVMKSGTSVWLFTGIRSSGFSSSKTYKISVVLAIML